MFQVGRVQSPTSLFLLKELYTKGPLVPLQDQNLWLNELTAQRDLKELEPASSLKRWQESYNDFSEYLQNFLLFQSV